MRLEVRVVPNAKKFSVSIRDGIWKIRVPAKAEDNEANKDLVRELGRVLGKRAAIVQGAKSRKKVIEIEGEENEVLGKMREIAQED